MAVSDDVSAAASQWRDALEAWAIPDDILAAAPASPWSLSVARFADRARRQAREATPSDDVARAALGEGGSVLDVGCGGGAATVALVPPATHAIGVDTQTAMLMAFSDAVQQRGASSETYVGRWPDVAAEVPAADVAVCQDVAYNVPDLAAFTAALTARARRRVVLTLPQMHPLAWLSPYWRELHGLDRPSSPTADDADQLLRAAGLDVARVEWQGRTLWGSEGAATHDDLVETVRVRLCLPATRDPDIVPAVARVPPPRYRDVVTLSWPGTAA